MDRRSKERIGINGYQDKLQIIAVMCGSLVGELLQYMQERPIGVILPISFLVIGKSPTPRTIGPTRRPGVIVPFADRKCEDPSLNDGRPALAISDHFKDQLTYNITQEIEANNIHSVLIPAAHTGQLQPIYISINKVVKSFLRSKFTEWYSDELA